MLSDKDVIEIQKLIDNCTKNEQLHESIKKYFLEQYQNTTNFDHTRIAWAVYQNIIQHKSIR